MKTIRNQFYSLLALGCAAFTLSFAIPSKADAAAYIKFDGIDGESKDKDHDKWIDILSIDWGAHKPGGGATGQSRRRGSVVVEDLSFAKELDKASPKLQEKCLMGEIIPKLEIELTRPVTDANGETREVVYLKYELKNVLITSTRFHYEAGTAGNADPVPTEDFSLNFEEIKVTYTELAGDGSKKGNVEYSWKVEEGEG